MNTYISHLDRIATDIELQGVAPNETAIATVVERARRAGVTPVLVAVLSDAVEPEVARARAFGMVAAELAAADLTTAELTAADLTTAELTAAAQPLPASARPALVGTL